MAFSPRISRKTKKKQGIRNIHYNIYANHREAFKLAVAVGDTFEVGEVEKSLERKILTNLLL